MATPDLYKTFDAEEPITILEPGMSLAGRYKLIKQIGRGGMGVIWSAEERAAGRKVVLKFVPNELKNFESAVAQLKESFQKIHGLQHQHICPVYTLEEEVSFGYYHVMKWLDGETLDEYIIRTVGRQQPLPFEDVLRILRPVAEALDYAHGQRIIHRDIKPSNIFVVWDEAKKFRDVQVIDFGLASEIRSSLSRVSQIQFDNSGTRPYMAPEQWRGRPQSGATDQYALAVVAYEMLSGYVPFDGDDVQMLGNAILNFPPEPIREMSEQVNAALLKALAKDGSGRFENCAQFVAALGGAENPVVIKTSSVPLPKQSSGASRTGTTSIAPGVDSLMTRGHLSLEDSDWKKSIEFFDNVLNLDAKYAPAYIGLLCAELKVQTEEQLGDFETPISEQGNFKKAVRFAEEEYKAKIEGYDEKIRERLRIEQERRAEQERQRQERLRQEAERLAEQKRQEQERFRQEAECLAEQERQKQERLRQEAERLDAQKRQEQEAVARRMEVELLSFCQPNCVAGKRETLMVKGVEYAFRWCPPGTFTMGSPVRQEIVEKGILWDTKKVVGGEADRSANETPHEVTLSKGFWMLETQVTRAMWESVMEISFKKGDKRLPVGGVSWEVCQEFIRKLNAAIEAGMEGVLARNDGV